MTEAARDRRSTLIWRRRKTVPSVFSEWDGLPQDRRWALAENWYGPDLAERLKSSLHEGDKHERLVTNEEWLRLQAEGIEIIKTLRQGLDVAKSVDDDAVWRHVVAQHELEAVGRWEHLGSLDRFYGNRKMLRLARETRQLLIEALS